MTVLSPHRQKVRGDPASRRRGVVRSIIVTARPRQWIKNGLVFAAPAAAGILLQPWSLAKAVAAFVAFCLASSGMYCMNDAKDRVRDAAHPTKRSRPVAAGELSQRAALMAAAAFVAGAVVVAAAGAGAALTAAVGGYLVLAVAYTHWLKDIVLIDIFAVAAMFVLRAAAGGFAVGVYLSSWFLLVACFGALFVVTGKRFAEYRALGTARGDHRKTLSDYSEPMLRSMLTSSSTVTIMAYCLWAFEGQGSRNILAALSILPFVLALYRYAILREAGSSESPEDLLFRDRFLQVASAFWLTSVCAGVYIG